MEYKDALQAVKEIKVMMEKTSKFLSFSGISIVLTGLYALTGAYFAHRIISPVVFSSHRFDVSGENSISTLLLLACAVFIAALVTVLLFSFRKAVKNGIPFFNKLTYRTFLNFFIPLLTGGLFCIALMANGYYGVIAPVMLLFYGLSLINVSKFTYSNTFWLGLCELVLGIVSAFLPGFGLWFWAIGFGMLHIFYGICFYFFIERREKQV